MREETHLQRTDNGDGFNGGSRRHPRWLPKQKQNKISINLLISLPKEDNENGGQSGRIVNIKNGNI